MNDQLLAEAAVKASGTGPKLDSPTLKKLKRMTCMALMSSAPRQWTQSTMLGSGSTVGKVMKPSKKTAEWDASVVMYLYDPRMFDVLDQVPVYLERDRTFIVVAGRLLVTPEDGEMAGHGQGRVVTLTPGTYTLDAHMGSVILSVRTGATTLMGRSPDPKLFRLASRQAAFMRLKESSFTHYMDDVRAARAKGRRR